MTTFSAYFCLKKATSSHHRARSGGNYAQRITRRDMQPKDGFNVLQYSSIPHLLCSTTPLLRWLEYQDNRTLKMKILIDLQKFWPHKETPQQNSKNLYSDSIENIPRQSILLPIYIMQISQIRILFFPKFELIHTDRLPYKRDLTSWPYVAKYLRYNW